ncbi:response regulator transcription factor [Bradyrhizobium sp.]|uniref:response regulator transcription factor n=1 Tax=Bradyrhizobium sp. TaxID=376 RepID=UPI001ECCBE4D|nr:response regulator [Bradyrhizobium sp.]MBV8918694.1 response regulator transcription factor [Bradyrhizobium sp.]MBV9985203.1 response regulator transcription factor [Bradyrhizobium sp.]
MQDDSIVFVIDDEQAIREALDSLFRSAGVRAMSFASVADFLGSERPDAPACLVLDVRLPGLNGLDFHGEMDELGIRVPVVFITAHGDVPMSVRAMRAGAVDFLIKPFQDQELLDAVRVGFARDRLRRASLAAMATLKERYESLTMREKEILWLVVAGQQNKQIAARLGLSVITVKLHRGQLMRKMQARSLIDLVRKTDILSRTIDRGAIH